jgi:hypothetical protein
MKVVESKLDTRNQNDYFGKGLQVFFPKNNFLHANEFLNEFFCNESKRILKFSPMNFIINHY